MTARQPRTPQEAAMLDPMGLLPPPRPNIGGGMFGGSARRRRPPFQIGGGGPNYGADDGRPMDVTASPPPISMAPPPPTDWRKTVGSDLMAQLPTTPPQPMLGDTLPPAPPMRGGMFGNVAAAPGLAPPMSEKIGSGGNLFGGMRAKAQEKARDKPGFFDRGGGFRDILGGLGDGLAVAGGGQASYVPAMLRRRQDEQNHLQRLQEMAQEWRLRSSQPEYRTINNQLVRFTPSSGESEVLFSAPEDYETYADTFGYEPGTEGYERAVRDYVLRGGGPTATDNYNLREDHRQANREDLEGIRQNNRIGLQDRRQAGQRALKATPTYRQSNPLPPRVGGRGDSGRGGSSGVREGQTATNPQTGAKVVYRGGKWVTAR